MKILIIAGFDRSLINFRSVLIRDLIAGGCEVVAAAPPEHAEVPGKLAELGAHFVGVALARTGMNPVADYLTYRRLRKLFAAERPDLVLSYTIKPVIYGSLAAAHTGVPGVFALITGLGTAFHTPGVKGWVMKFAATRLYRWALRGCQRVIVQNPDIARLFVEQGIAPAGKLTVVRGSGVDLSYFASQPVAEGAVHFLYLGRLLRDKGLREYAEAAQRVRQSFPTAVCRIVGAPDPNPSGIPLDEVRGWQENGAIEYLPHESDIRGRLRECSVYVLPSYHEGMPRSVLEAMAVGRALITTDTIGCRETVRLPTGAIPDAQGITHGENGLLVPVRDAGALTQAMLLLAGRPELVQAMGARSRAMAEEEFDVRKVNESMLSAMGIGRTGGAN